MSDKFKEKDSMNSMASESSNMSMSSVNSAMQSTGSNAHMSVE